MTKMHQLISDFKVGDVVRLTSATEWSSVVRHSGQLGEPGTKHTVTAVHPNHFRNGVLGIERVGDIEVEGVDVAYGHLLFDPPVEEDQPGFDAAARIRILEDYLQASQNSYKSLSDHTSATIRQLHSEVEQAQAAQALEAHRANKAEARARRQGETLNYLRRNLGKRARGLLEGYLARANEGA